MSASQSSEDLPILDATELSEQLTLELLVPGPIPASAAADAAHIANVAVNGANFLLTWNCKHIANAVLRPRIEVVCRAAGYTAPVLVLCTPEELASV